MITGIAKISRDSANFTPAFTSAAPVRKYVGRVAFRFPDDVANTGIEVVSSTDYSPFGSPMGTGGMEGDERRYAGSEKEYRFGYQGQFAEEDAETGYNQFELRLYDGRIGRWNTIDPYFQYYSPYLALGNNPISKTDPDGGCDECPDQLPYDFGGSYFQDLIEVASKSFANLFFKTEEVAPGVIMTVPRENVAAVVQGPVAISITVNGATEMYTGGFDVETGFILGLTGENLLDIKNFADGGVPLVATGFSASQTVKITFFFTPEDKNNFRLTHINGQRVESNVSFSAPTGLSPVVTAGGSASVFTNRPMYTIHVAAGAVESVPAISTPFVGVQINGGASAVY